MSNSSGQTERTESAWTTMPPTAQPVDADTDTGAGGAIDQSNAPAAALPPPAPMAALPLNEQSFVLLPPHAQPPALPAETHAALPAAARTEPAEPHHPVRTGSVTAVRDGQVHVRFTGGDSGTCPAEQFEKPPRVGDRVDFEVLCGEADGHLSLRRAQTLDADALTEGMIVEGDVTGLSTGGLELKVAGRRAFMPASQIDIHPVEDLSPFINTKIRCRITSLNKKHTRIVVSRRSLLDEELKDQRLHLLEQMKPGQVVEGVVRKIESFGVFVTVGDIDGLIRMPDLAHHRVNRAEDVVQVGQTIQTQVLRVSPQSGKLQLGLKQLLPDPWDTLSQTHPEGSVFEAPVKQITNFGAFVEVVPGIDGLIPISEMSWGRIEKVEDVLQVGQPVKVSVLSVDRKRHRVTLSLRKAAGDPWAEAATKYAAGATVTGTVTRLLPFGAFIELEPGVEGMCHVSQLSNRRIKEAGDAVKLGQTVRAKVMELDVERGRLSLSIRALTDPKGAAEAAGSARAGEASRDEIRKRVKPESKAKAVQSLMGNAFGGDGLKGGLG